MTGRFLDGPPRFFEGRTRMRMAARIHWKRRRIYALNEAGHRDNVRHLFLRRVDALHPALLCELHDIVFPLWREAAARHLPALADKHQLEVRLETLEELREFPDVAPVVEAKDALLARFNLRNWWVDRFVSDRLGQWVAEQGFGETLGWYSPGPDGLPPGDPLALVQFGADNADEIVFVPDGAPLAEHRAARADGRLSMLAIFPWNPTGETLEAFRHRIEQHICEKQAWARRRGVKPLPVGYQPDHTNAWVADDVLRRRMDWVVRRQVDRWSTAMICKQYRLKGLEARRVVQRESTALGRYIGLRFTSPPSD